MTRRSRRITLAVVGPLLVLLVVLAALLPVPYLVLSPGPVFNALGTVDGTPVVVVDGAKTFETDGSLDVTTVYELGGPGSRLSLLGAVKAWLSPTSSVVPRELFYPDNTSPADSTQRSVEEMELSQQTSVAAALRLLDKPVRTVVAVGSVLADSPAEGTLRAGDVFLEVDGVPVKTAAQVRRLISDRTPGDDVDLVMRRDGQRLNLTVATAASPDDPERAIVGVVPTLVYVSPIDVKISLGDVGGPSAGLMFALSIVDKLTPGALTDGRAVAGTGTIDANGGVGAIGGIEQKMSGAADDGAELFLAPYSNCSDVIGNIPDGLVVVPVHTLKEAVDTVEAFAAGGTDLPTCAA
jgi:PDZ domain-containing protein